MHYTLIAEEHFSLLLFSHSLQHASNIPTMSPVFDLDHLRWLPSASNRPSLQCRSVMLRSLTLERTRSLVAAIEGRRDLSWRISDFVPLRVCCFAIF